MSKPTHFSLFSGIGGIDLAAEWAGFESIGQCEYADFPTKVLEKNFPNVERWRDVRSVTDESIRDRLGEGYKIDLLSGGFPCQPHSLAGKRRASGDERDLWGEFCRVIGETKPKWVLGENVRGLLSSEDGRFFGRILRDLVQMGYGVGWCCFPACWVGAVHRRERVFIIAHSKRKVDLQLLRDEREEKGGEGEKTERSGDWQRPRNGAEIHTVLYPIDLELTKPLVTRADDGFPGVMDRNKALGNAVVPQQVYPILKAICDTMKENKEGM